ncbi:BgTH12-06887 [Blumeria graminis f. sp. triticale]|nr:BgTH12-06887 [Blumeria graminis f. sp. triticale]
MNISKSSSLRGLPPRWKMQMMIAEDVSRLIVQKSARLRNSPFLQKAARRYTSMVPYSNDNPNLHSYSSLDQAGSSSRLIFEVNSGKQLNQKDPSIGSLTELSRRERDRLHSYLGSIDCGTTSSRFLIFDRNGNPVASHQVELNNIYPEPGWHEQDPIELITSVESCINEATKAFIASGRSKDEIKAIGITNHRETTICWDTRTGQPLYNAIVWSDTRTISIVRELKKQVGAHNLQQLCGLPLSTYPSSLKLIWMLRNVKAIKQAYEEGNLSFGTVDSWLIYKLNNGKEADVHVTDTTNASRTMFMNIHTLKYDKLLFDFFRVNQNNISLPKICPSADFKSFGCLASGALKGIKITGCLGDQSAALVGQCGFSPGQAKNTYGTGCFLLYNVGDRPVISNSGLLATVAYDFGHEFKPIYALEGSIAVAGSGVKFLTKNLGLSPHPSGITEMAESVRDNGGVVFVTAFSGLFAPYWIDDAKGTMFGITAHTQRGHIARATLEATCFQTKAILDAMQLDSGRRLESLTVDGGMSQSDTCMQIQADIIRIPVERPLMRETTALGAAIAAGFGIKYWHCFDELKPMNRKTRTVFRPQLDENTSSRMFRKWNQAVQMSRGWDQDDPEQN